MTASSAPAVGVLISNLGTPQAPTPAAVRRYLAEFLSDRRVIALSPILWQPILHGIILRVRPKKSARLYQKVWTDQGSPLLVHSQAQQAALKAELQSRGYDVPIALGMRYGKPSIAQALEELGDVTHLIALPLYPQFSNTTTASTFDALNKALTKHPSAPRLSLITSYADNTGYLDACVSHLREQLRECGPKTRLLLSFHGLPAESEQQGDPYAGQCRATARRIAAALELPWKQWGLSFQSRFGPKQWLTPYTDDVLQQWAASGTSEVAVFCPGFSVDCLETLEEIAQESREVFLSNGGQQFHYLPALNEQPRHIQMMANLICNYMTPA